MTIDANAAWTVSAALPYPARRGALQVVEFGEEHIGEAARLHAATYLRARDSNGAMPAGPLDPAPVESLLRRALEAGPALAAGRDGALAGYTAGFPVPGASGTSTIVWQREGRERNDDRSR